VHFSNKQIEQEKKECVNAQRQQGTSVSPTNKSVPHANPLPFAPLMGATINQSTKRNIAEKLPSPDAPKFSNQTNHY
jgi:hypothetical protein